MEDNNQLSEIKLDDNAEQQTSLEIAVPEQNKTKKTVRKFLRKLINGERKILYAIIVCIIVVAVLFFGFILPWLLDDHETQYVSVATLKEAVAIENLSTVDYVYCGIAEKSSNFLWMDNVDFRVRYEAHVRAYYAMGDIQFSIDQESKIITAYLPNAEIGAPVLDETKFGYLPEDANGDISEILSICKEDAANEINRTQIQEEANENLQNIVKGLTMPLLNDEWKLEFKSLSEYEGSASNEAE